MVVSFRMFGDGTMESRFPLAFVFFFWGGVEVLFPSGSGGTGVQ